MSLYTSKYFANKRCPNNCAADDCTECEAVVKRQQAFDIIRKHCDNSILKKQQRENGQIIHYLVVGELGKYVLSEEEYNLLVEMLK